MGILQITLFGGVRVTHNNWLTEVKLTREIQALLAYLLLQRHRAHSREVLVGLFWGEHNHEKARRALNTALWRLKKSLEPPEIPAGTYLISAQPGEVGFNQTSRYWLDVEVFEQETRQLIIRPPETANEPNILQLEGILELYKGELLEGLYEDWALRERERMRALYLKSLMYLVQYYKHREAYEEASDYGQRILHLDPIREDIHREMMKVYLESGQRALAARQYEICRLSLAKELGILPMEETQMLYAQIFPEAHKGHSQPVPSEQLNFEQTLEQLRQAWNTIDLANDQAQQALQSLVRFTTSDDSKFSESFQTKD